ncbi:MAG: hypothetical protein JSU90_09115 [Nitrospiraceae bacterium]|nr:MAG: hypothetical protein JSU90_09115 [Nitrospiraceae bacterium]
MTENCRRGYRQRRDGLRAAGMVPLLCAVMIVMTGNIVSAGTYMSTKHGSEADRRVMDADFPYTTKGLCAHCHEQHASIDGQEPFPPAAEGATSYTLFRSNFGSSKNELCFACHELFSLSGMPLGYGRYGIYQGKTKYNSSIHKTDSGMVWNPDPSPPGPPFSASSTLTDAGNCHNCHNPHGYDDGSGLIPQMLFARDSKDTDIPAYEMGCEACHDGTQGGAGKDVKTQLNKAYAHPAHDYNDRHVIPETGASEGGSSFGNPPTYDKRHAECVDCHNPHTVVSGTTHTAATDGNAVSDVLKYVWGVEPSWPAIWTQPTSLTVRKPPTYSDGAQYEYQICFKCHSYYGLGTLTNAVSTITGPSGALITDQAWEFNRNNKSAHPVVVSLNNQSGSTAPKALLSGQMSSPWTAVGTQTMYCSDCHGANDETTTGAQGPHGSTRKFMLKGTSSKPNAQYWPTKSDGVTLWTLSDLGGATAGTDLFCVNCHPNSRNNNNVHQEGGHRGDGPISTLFCVECHSAVPHGSKRSRLIGYSSDPSPYDLNNNTLRITGYKKAAGPSSYGTGNCQSSCYADHTGAVSGAEP